MAFAAGIRRIRRDSGRWRVKTPAPAFSLPFKMVVRSRGSTDGTHAAIASVGIFLPSMVSTTFPNIHGFNNLDHSLTCFQSTSLRLRGLRGRAPPFPPVFGLMPRARNPLAMVRGFTPTSFASLGMVSPCCQRFNKAWVWVSVRRLCRPTYTPPWLISMQGSPSSH